MVMPRLAPSQRLLIRLRALPLEIPADAYVRRSGAGWVMLVRDAWRWWVEAPPPEVMGSGDLAQFRAALPEHRRSRDGEGSSPGCLAGVGVAAVRGGVLSSPIPALTLSR